MNEQSLVAVGGLALVGATFWKSPQRPAVDGLIWDNKSTPEAKTSLLQIGGELALLLLLYLLAGQSDDMGLAMVVIVLTLWILFFMTIYGGKPAATVNKKG